MDKIKGIQINVLPFDIQNDVGVLLYEEFPSTEIFDDGNDIPIIKEWIDCSDDDEIERFIIYKSSKDSLKKFIDEKISQKELIQSCEDGIVYIIDETDETIQTITILAADRIPKDYDFPIDSYFKKSDGVDTDKIYKYFGLEDIEEEKDGLDEFIKQLARQNNTNVFNIHLKEGYGIKYGRVDTEILGNSLTSFDRLYKEVALDFYFGKNRGELKITSKEIKEKVKLASTEVFHSKAASFIVYLKPKYDEQLNLFGEERATEKITQNLFNLFEVSKDEGNLLDNYHDYSDFVFSSYRQFLKKIREYNIRLGINWTNNTNSVFLKEEFTLLKSHNIIELIDQINTENLESFKVKGKFVAVNCKTNSFTFESIEGEEYKGYFDKLIQESSYLLTFTKLYEVTIERKTVKEAGKTSSKIKDTIIAHYEIKE